jgi:hypothetical protein
VLYDRENIPWLERLGGYADEALIADSRIRDKRVFEGFEKIGDNSATTIPNLDELKEFGDVAIYYRKYRQVICSLKIITKVPDVGLLGTA